MSQDTGVTTWELVRTKVRIAGPAGLIRIVLAKLIQPVAISWRRFRDRHQPPIRGSRELAQIFQVHEEHLADRVDEIKQALATRLPTSAMDAPALRAIYRAQAPEELEATVRAADRLCDRVFNLLGSGPTSLGRPIDWHRDFKCGFRWDPQQYYLHVAHGRGSGADIKVPWELSRCHHLPVLAQAYLLTDQTRYAQEIVDQLDEWIDGNPPGRGVNWACPMEVAIRAVNWLWALGLIINAPVVGRPWLTRMLDALANHGRHLMANLERRSDGITTNHYLADVVGVLYLALCLPECRDSAGWRTFAVRELVREMDRQVLPDGTHYESSIPYHRLVCEMFLSAALLCRHHRVPLPEAFHQRLRLMCEFVSAYTKPNGLAPQVGDGDNGRLHVLTGYDRVDTRDHRHVLAAGAVLYDRDDWWHDAGPRRIEAAWYGEQGRDRFARPSDSGQRRKSSTCFSAGGFYIMRDREDYVLFNCNPVGTRGIGTHKHNDVLSLEVQLGGEDILVDPGCFLYTADPRMYDLFRGTAHHSTVVIDGREQNRFIAGKFFCLHPDGQPRVLCWETGDTTDRVSAEFDGYQRLSRPIRHRRDVRVHWPGVSVQVVDHFSGRAGSSAVHSFEWTWTCAPGCRVVREDAGWSIRTASQSVLIGDPVCEPAGALAAMDARVENACVAPSYGAVQETVWLRWRGRGVLPLSVAFTMLTPADRPS